MCLSLCAYVRVRGGGNHDTTCVTSSIICNAESVCMYVCVWFLRISVLCVCMYVYLYVCFICLFVGCVCT